MNRLLGIAAAMLLTFLVLVPVATAADPWNWGRTESAVIVTGADVTLAADQTVEAIVVIGGHARIEGTAKAVFVLGGTAELIGAHADGVIAVQSRVTIDGASSVSGDIRTLDSSVDAAPGAALGGRIRAVGLDVAFGWVGIGTALFFVYLAFAISLIAVGLVVAAVAGRQTRAAAALISSEPLPVLGAGFAGLIGLLTAGVLAVVTLVGIPFGVGLLAVVLPLLFVLGYVVAGIWIGEQIVGRARAEVDRPYLAALVGLSFVGAISIIPPIGGLISFVGFGAVVLLLWRAARGTPATVPSARVGQAAPVAG
jgi:hypothetical protein